MVCPSKNLKARVLTLLILYSGTRAHCAHCLFKGFKNCAFICFLFRNVSVCRQKERNCFYSYHSKQQTVVLQRFIYIISLYSFIIYYLIIYFQYIYYFIFETNYASKYHQILKLQSQLRYSKNALKRDTR